LAAASALAFTQTTQKLRLPPRSSRQNRQMAVDPEVSNSLASSLQHLIPHDVVAHHHNWETLLSTLYTASAETLLKPAHEHTQPFWGAPDPYLSAGKSIAPTVDMGIEKATQELTQQAQAAAAKGWNLLDSTRVTPENSLPGFTNPSGILGPHDPRLPAETPESFAVQVEWSAKYLNVVDKLPYVAFTYALIEFFLLRPNLDVYQEDVEEEQGAVMAETVVTTGVRLGALCFLAIVTAAIFG